jgi:gamma-glutamyltranspeptidase/glutathione hydrolase
MAMNTKTSRRTALRLAGGSAAFAFAAPYLSLGADRSISNGMVSGEPTAEKVGAKILADGGNAVDAIVAAAWTAAVVSPSNTGIGGYGGCLTLALANRRKVTSIDFNSAAPAAMRADTFKPDANGQVPGRVNEFGWLAAGVPGIPAGLQLALNRHGTCSLREVLEPAIDLAEKGFALPAGQANGIAGSAAQFRRDAGSLKLYFKDDKPLKAGDIFRNPDLAAVLRTLAERNSVDSFYRGDIARHLADGFQKNGGIVSVKDLAAYRALEVEPLQLRWDNLTLYTAPPTAGGITVLQALAALQAMNWHRLPDNLERTWRRVEALRLAWHDRLTLLGDTSKAKVPVGRLLSAAYAKESADRVDHAVKAGRPQSFAVTSREHGGTINLSAGDRFGNLVALTLTHGGGFGARCTVDGLGLTLGHGMSRFDPHPGHPNCPGPGKRPLHNMCPTVILRDGLPVLAVGGRGGRKIPNAVFEVLTQYVALGGSMEHALAAPRMHTEGNLDLELEKAWPQSDFDQLGRHGYKLKTAGSATLSAVSFDPLTGESKAALR